MLTDALEPHVVSSMKQQHGHLFAAQRRYLRYLAILAVVITLYYVYFFSYFGIPWVKWCAAAVKSGVISCECLSGMTFPNGRLCIIFRK